MSDNVEKRSETDIYTHIYIYIYEFIDRDIKQFEYFFDLTKAYDVINHDILLDELNLFGIRGKTNLWFKPYLAPKTVC